MTDIQKGTLTVLKINKSIYGGTYVVECSCGNIFKCFISRFNIYSGRGCRECRYNGSFNGNYRHGGNTDNRPEYNSWRAMINRCYSTKYRRYDRYGGRGISVCDSWRGKQGFINFLKDMGKKPTSKHSIDRINNDGDYKPSNCRWATQSEQIRNSSVCIK